MSSGAAPSLVGYATLVAAAVFAAGGQVLLKLGATGRSSLVAFANLQVAAGLAFYMLGALLWIAALSKAPLNVVYPFTALTFALVYFASIVLLGERPTPLALAGVALVLVGLTLILWTRSPA